jgi:hypothetical protein
MRILFLTSFLFIQICSTRGQQLVNKPNSKSLDWETAMTLYSNGEIGLYTGFQYNWKGHNSVIVAPLLITDQDYFRLGAKIAYRAESICGSRNNSKAFVELGVQYFEIQGSSNHFTNTILVTEGIGLIMPIKKSEFSFYFGGGFDLGRAFVKEKPGFAGIVRISWQISDVFKF